MDTDITKKSYPHKDITSRIIAAAHKVHNTLGCGFLEKIYHNSLVIELTKQRFEVDSQWPINVQYEGQIVGEYKADILVNRKVIIEVKATEDYNTVYEAQLLNYLRATGYKVGLIVNFAKRVFVKRMIF